MNMNLWDWFKLSAYSFGPLPVGRNPSNRSILQYEQLRKNNPHRYLSQNVVLHECKAKQAFQIIVWERFRKEVLS